MNYSCIVRFIQSIEAEIATFPDAKLVFCVDEGHCNLTNTIFLLGSYIILMLDKYSQQVHQSFAWLNSACIEPYRDATTLISICNLPTPGPSPGRGS